MTTTTTPTTNSTGSKIRSNTTTNDEGSKSHEEESITAASKTLLDNKRNNFVYDIFEVQQIHNIRSKYSGTTSGSSTTNHNQKRYGSYFVNSQIVQDGSLWITSRVDPLFFVLSMVAPGQAGREVESSATHKWNPKEQLLSSLPTPVRLALDVKQLGHLMDTNNMGDGGADDDDDDDLLYKLNETKVLVWLQAKYHQTFEKVKSKLVANHLATQQKLEELTTSHNQATKDSIPTFSACDPSLNLDDDDDDEICNDPKKDKEHAESNAAAAGIVKHDKDEKNPRSNVSVLLPSEEMKAKQYALQLVCEYLTEYWRIQLATSLDLLELVQDGNVKKGTGTKQQPGTTNPITTTTSSPSQELTISTMSGGTKRSWETYATTGTITPDTKEEEEARAAAEKRKKLNAAQTAGLKRLAKVNTKGMKSLTSFFGGAPSKTKNTKK